MDGPPHRYSGRPAIAGFVEKDQRRNAQATPPLVARSGSPSPEPPTLKLKAWLALVAPSYGWHCRCTVWNHRAVADKLSPQDVRSDALCSLPQTSQALWNEPVSGQTSSASTTV